MLAAWDAAPIDDEIVRVDERTRDGQQLVPAVEVARFVERIPHDP